MRKKESDDQIKIPGIDNDFTKAADALIDARQKTEDAKTNEILAEKKVIRELKKIGKPIISHSGLKFSIRRGRIVKDKIIIKTSV